MKNYSKEIKNLLVFLGVLIFIWWIFFSPIKTTFSFELKEGKIIEGEVYFDTIFIGDTIEGKIKVSEQETIPYNVIFKGIDNGKEFELIYDFPSDYLEYSEIPFSLTKEYIDFAKEYYPHKKEDLFSRVIEPHFKKTPITWKIEDYSQCWGTEEEKIRKAFYEIEIASEGYLTFKEEYDNPDIIVECYMSRSDRFSEVWDEVDSTKICENVTFQGKKNSVKDSDFNLLDSEYRWSSNMIYENEENTIWEICKVDRYLANSLDLDNTIGEGGPTDYIGNIILQGNAKFYGEDNSIITCTSGFPLPEVHELLHVLGFSHIIEESELPMDFFGYPRNDPRYITDVLYPYKNCLNQTQINEHYSSCLKYIYSGGQEGICSKEVKFMFE